MKTLACSLFMFVLVLSARAQHPGTAFYEMPYDTTADPFAQLAAATSVAAKEHKLILLDVGGEWCSWCHRLDAFFRQNPDVAGYLTEHYVPVKINFSLANKNEAFLSQFPKIEGYPHLFVLDAAGTVIQSQNTAELEEGKGYNKQIMLAFLKKWAERRQEI